MAAGKGGVRWRRWKRAKRPYSRPANASASTAGKRASKSPAAPAYTVALAESIAPKTVGKLLDAAGKNAKADEDFTALAPDEDKLGSTAEGDKDVKEVEEKERGQQQEDIRQSAKDAAEGFAETAAVIADAFKAITAGLESVRRQAELTAANAAAK